MNNNYNINNNNNLGFGVAGPWNFCQTMAARSVYCDPKLPPVCNEWPGLPKVVWGQITGQQLQDINVTTASHNTL